MTTIMPAESIASQDLSLLVTFCPPALRKVIPRAFCNDIGSVNPLEISSTRYYCEESPLAVQPDLIVDKDSNAAIGVSFMLPEPDLMLPRCREMLRGLDAASIRVSERADDGHFFPEQASVSLDVFWGMSASHKVQFAQLDFGLWAFLYPSSNPVLFLGDGIWTPPQGFIIGDLKQLASDISINIS